MWRVQCLRCLMRFYFEQRMNIFGLFLTPHLVAMNPKNFQDATLKIVLRDSTLHNQFHGCAWRAYHQRILSYSCLYSGKISVWLSFDRLLLHSSNKIIWHRHSKIFYLWRKYCVLNRAWTSGSNFTPSKRPWSLETNGWLVYRLIDRFVSLRLEHSTHVQIIK